MKFLSNLIYSVGFYFCIFFSKEEMHGKKVTKLLDKIQKKMTIVKSFAERQQERYLMHSLLKAGDAYKLGEATVTLAKFGVEGKLEVQQKIEAATLRRAEREFKMREKAIDIMLMKPDELMKYRIEEWLEKRKEFQKKLEEFDKLPDDPPENKPNQRIS